LLVAVKYKYAPEQKNVIKF